MNSSYVPPEHLDADLTVPAFLRRIRDRFGDRPAITFDDETWSYQQLLHEIGKVRSALLGLGATKGTRIAIIMGARPEWVTTVLGAMSIGALAIPISTYEPAVKRHDLLRHTDASIVVIQDQLLKHSYFDDLVRDHPRLWEEPSGPLLDESLPFLQRVIHFGGDESRGRILSWKDFVEKAPSIPTDYLTSLEREVHPMDDALVVYTSGTSGPSKGVIHTQRNVSIQFDRIGDEFTLTPNDVVWGTFPLFWSAGVAWVLGATLGEGAHLILQEVFDPVEAVQLIEKYRVTVIHVTPPQVAEIEEALESHPADVSSLRIVPRGSLSNHLDLPEDAPFGGASLGLTEALTLAASIPWDSPVELRLETHGRPLPGMTFKIVDPSSGETLGANEHGEIAFKGSVLMRGYHKMFPETYLDDEGYYRTKDSGYLDDEGFLHFTGRLSHLIRTNAANVSPGEVESALHELADVKIAAVIGVPDPELGQRIVACVVPFPGSEPSEESVRRRLRDRLASYKIPSRIFFIEEPELPTTGTGKPLLSSVEELVAARMGSATKPEETPRF